MRHAIVTGGSSGIGLSIARLLAERGDAVTLVASREGPLRDARAAVGTLPGVAAERIGSIRCDVRDGPALAAEIAEAEARLGACDTLVTSAGVVRPGRFEDLDAAEFSRQMDINFIGTVNAVRAVYPGMAARGRGRIGMICSAAGLLGIFGHSAYAPSKFAVRGFAEALRMEARPRGVSISVCYPPDTDTPQLAAEAEHKPPETHAIAGSARVWRADDVARLTVDGIERGRKGIYPGLEIKALSALGPLLRPLLDRYFDHIVASVQRTT